MSKPTVVALHAVISLLLAGMWLFGAKVIRTMFISTEHGFKYEIGQGRMEIRRELQDKSFHQIYVRDASVTNHHGMVISGFQYFVPPDGPLSQTVVYAWSDPNWGDFYTPQHPQPKPSR